MPPLSVPRKLMPPLTARSSAASRVRRVLLFFLLVMVMVRDIAAGGPARAARFSLALPEGAAEPASGEQFLLGGPLDQPVRRMLAPCASRRCACWPSVSPVARRS